MCSVDHGCDEFHLSTSPACYLLRQSSEHSRIGRLLMSHFDLVCQMSLFAGATHLGGLATRLFGGRTFPWSQPPSRIRGFLVDIRSRPEAEVHIAGSLRACIVGSGGSEGAFVSDAKKDSSKITFHDSNEKAVYKTQQISAFNHQGRKMLAFSQQKYRFDQLFSIKKGMKQTKNGKGHLQKHAYRRPF